MKFLLILSSLFPLMAFSGEYGEELFYLNEQGTEFLQHMAFDEEEMFEELQGSELSFFEMDEEDSSLIPWAEEAPSGCLSLLFQEGEFRGEGFEDELFTYVLEEEMAEPIYQPTLEQVPSRERQLFSRPKVVPSKKEGERAGEEKAGSSKRR